MHKNTVALIVSLMFGLAGVFWFLTAREEFKGYLHKKEKEIRAKKRQKDFDKMMKLVNSQH